MASFCPEHHRSRRMKSLTVKHFPIVEDVLRGHLKDEEVGGAPPSVSDDNHLKYVIRNHSHLI